MCGIVLLLPLTSHARRIGYVPTAEQLQEQATLVCNGRVISIEPTGPDLTSIYAGGVPQGYPETWMSAHVQVLHTFKGTAPTEIIFRYRVPQPSGFLMNSPIHLRLEEGERYRFFLKPGPSTGEFVCVLDGRIDDGFGVQLLCPDEADDSPILGTSEAVRIALDYLHAKKPRFTYDPSLTSVWPEPGGMEEEITLVASNNSGAEQATVAIFRDRTVNEKSSQLDEHR